MVQRGASSSADAKHILDILALIHSICLVLISVYVFQTARKRAYRQQYVLSEYNKVIVLCIVATLLYAFSFLYFVKVTIDKANEHGIFLLIEYLEEALNKIGMANLILTLAINVTMIVLLVALNVVSAMAQDSLEALEKSRQAVVLDQYKGLELNEVKTEL